MPVSVTNVLSMYSKKAMGQPTPPASRKIPTASAQTAKTINDCTSNYQVINYDYPPDSVDFPEKLCVYNPSKSTIRWYGVITAEPK